jgi:hypothetical protein
VGRDGPGGDDVPCRGAKARHDQKAFSFFQQIRYDLAPTKTHWLRCSWKLLMPITFCAISTASAP